MNNLHPAFDFINQLCPPGPAPLLPSELAGEEYARRVEDAILTMTELQYAEGRAAALSPDQRAAFMSKLAHFAGIPTREEQDRQADEWEVEQAARAAETHELPRWLSA